MLADLYFTSLNTCSHAVALHWQAMKSSSPALASLSWTHLFLPRLWKPAPAWVRSALDNPHLPPRPWRGIRRWMDGWIFNFLLPPLHPLTSRADTYMPRELLCAESWAVLEMSLTKKKKRQLLKVTGHFEEFPLVFRHTQTRAAHPVLPNLSPSERY